jgi:hypothetical protein
MRASAAIGQILSVLWLLTQALQEGTSPRLRGTVLCLAVLIPEPPREEEFFGIEIKHDP